MTEAEKEILIASGTVIHNWSRVEGQLIALLWRCMETRTPAPATIIWGNVISIGPKLTIISEMLPLLVADKEARALWQAISEKVRQKSNLRNKVAHSEVVHFEDGPRLVPKYQSADMGQLGHADTDRTNAMDRLLENFETRGYTAKDIQDIAAGFLTIKETIRWYVDWVIEFKRIPHELDLDPIPDVVRGFLKKTG